MNETRQAIDSLSAAVKALGTGRPANLPETAASRRAVEELNAAEAAPAVPVEAVLEAVRRRIVGIIRRTGGVAAVDRRDLRDSCWLLWEEKDPLARQPGLMAAVLEQAGRLPSTRRNLIDAWLRHFRQDAPGIVEAGKELALLVENNSDPRLEVWRRADRKFKLFDCRFGPRRLAEGILRGPASVPLVLDDFGLSEPMRASGGYLRATQTEILELAADALRGASGRDVLNRIAVFLAPTDVLRFREPDAQGAIARGLLAPWLDGGRQPGDAIRAEVQRFLLAHLRDPRIRAENWRAAGPEATALMRRWLARASLHEFFEVVGEYALDLHWRYRRAFWSAYLNHGAIEDAWLAFGSKVLASARAERELGGAYSKVIGASSKHAALLMRIGDTIYCEWSHDGALRAWGKGDRHAPRLGSESYSREELTRSGLSFPNNPETGKHGAPDGNGLHHFGSEDGRWQGSAARLIALRGGPRLARSDWMPE